MRPRILLCALLCLAASAKPPEASAYAGADSFDFLFMESGARQSALGGAFVAGSNDANVLAYNPAGLAAMSSHHASFMHTSLFQSVQREHLAVAFRDGFGFSFDRLTFGELTRTTLSNPSGADADGFRPSATVLAAGGGLPLTDSLSVGTSLKYIRQSIDDVTASAWAGDAGIQAGILEEPALIAGFAVQNFGSRARFLSQREPLPLNVRAGAALSLDIFGAPVSFSFEANKASERDLILNGGLAISLHEHFTLRFGHNTRNDAGPGFAFGFGLIYSDYTFDYALVPYGVLGTSHQISLGIRWGKE